MAKILIIEDSPEVSKMLRDILLFEHHQVETVDRGDEGLSRLRAYSYDLAVLDWELPGMNGIDVCKEFRSSGGTTPILMLTANKKISEKSAGLDAGADDYLTKPFHQQELSSRVRALLRRSGSQVTSNVLKIGNVVLDPGSYRVNRNEDEIRLVPKEFAILEFLMRHRGIVFSIEAIHSRIWTSEEESSPEIVRTHIKNLRKKVDVEGQPSVIHTVHGVGYKVDEPKLK